MVSVFEQKTYLGEMLKHLVIRAHLSEQPTHIAVVHFPEVWGTERNPSYMQVLLNISRKNLRD